MRGLLIHSIIAVILFVGLLFIVGSSPYAFYLIFVYGAYAVYVAILYFYRAYHTWVEGDDHWGSKIAQFYSALFVFTVLVTLLALASKNSVGLLLPIGLFTAATDYEQSLQIVAVGLFYIIAGTPIVFPVHLFTFISSIKAIRTANREKRSKTFGVFMLIFSIFFLMISVLQFLAIIVILFKGGSIR